MTPNRKWRQLLRQLVQRLSHQYKAFVADTAAILPVRLPQQRSRILACLFAVLVFAGYGLSVYKGVTASVAESSRAAQADDDVYTLSGRVTDGNGNGIGGVTVSAYRFAEPNDSCAEARLIPTDGAIQNHTFTSPADADWAYFTIEAGDEYLIEALTPVDSAANIRVSLYADCASGEIDGQDKSFSPDVRVRFSAPFNGRVYLFLRNENTTGPADQPYMLSVRRLGAETPTGAVIIVAGRYRFNDRLQSNIYNGAESVYRLFQERGYPADRIYYIAPESRMGGINKSATVAELQSAITQWAPGKLDSNSALTLYLFDHGSPDLFYLDEPLRQRVTPGQLDEWLRVVESAHPGVRINVIYEACYSGSFIQQPGSISRPGRVIITSAPPNALARASRSGAIFSDILFAGLAQGSSLYASFDNAQRSTRQLWLDQVAWLDDNGDGVANSPNDGNVAQQRGFAYANTFDDSAWPPYIETVAQPKIENGRGIIEATVLADEGNPVKTVCAVIYPPDYVEPQPGEGVVDMVESPAPVSLLRDGNSNRYRVADSGFTQTGIYRIVVYAESENGQTARPVAVEVGSEDVYLPMITRGDERATLAQTTEKASSVFTVVTDANGGYTLPDLPAGSYVVSTQYDEPDITPVQHQVTLPESVSGADFVISASIAPTLTPTPSPTLIPTLIPTLVPTLVPTLTSTPIPTATWTPRPTVCATKVPPSSAARALQKF